MWPRWSIRRAASGHPSFPASTRGYVALVTWAECFGPVERVGVEGTGTYGAGLTRFVRAYGVEVVEVDRPDRSLRRRQGKSDPIDAQAAARATLAGVAATTPKTREGLLLGQHHRPPGPVGEPLKHHPSALPVPAGTQPASQWQAANPHQQLLDRSPAPARLPACCLAAPALSTRCGHGRAVRGGA
jgi:hypothetical protein